MSTITDTFNSVEEQVLDAIKQGQQAAIDAIESFAPGLKVPDAVAEVVDQSLEFAGKLLQAQRDFVSKLFTELRDSTNDTTTNA
jgi:hypothetical protein